MKLCLRVLKQEKLYILNKKLGKVYRIDLLIYISLILLAVLFCLQSTFSPFSIGGKEIDDGVFSYFGRAMTYGYTPYVDMFDHKGPVIYFINFFGHLIGGRTGVWVMQIINLAVTLVFCFKTLLLFVRKRWAYLTTIFMLILMVWCFPPGNHVEEFAQSFLFISLYIFSQFFMKDENLSKVKLMILGFCFACVLMLRINMVALWAVFCLVIVIKFVKEKKYARLGKFALWFTVGIMILLVPLVIYLLVVGGLWECIYQSIIFNVAYTGDGVEAESFMTVTKYFANIIISRGNFLGLSILAYIGCFVQYFKLKKDNDKSKHNFYIFVIAYLIFSVLNFLMLTMSLRRDQHYFQFYYPAVPVMTAIAFNGIENFIVKRNYIKSRGLTTVLLATIMVIFMSHLLFVGHNNVVKRMTVRDHHLEEICNVVREYTNEGDEISVYGNDCNIYIDTETFSSSKYIYQVPIGAVNPSILEEYLTHLKEKPPKIFILREKSLLQRQSYDIINQYILGEFQKDYILVSEIRNNVEGSNVETDIYLRTK